MTIEEYNKQMTQICNAIRKLQDSVESLSREVAAIKSATPVKEQKPIVELSDDDKAKITEHLQTDMYNNDEACGRIEWRRNICYVYYLPSDNVASEKQLEFGKKMISTYSKTERLNRFLLGKMLDVCKEYKLSRVQMQTIMEEIPEKPKPQPQPLRTTAVNRM